MQFQVHNATRGIYRRIYGLFEKVMVPPTGDFAGGHTYRHTGAFFVKPFFPKVKVDVAVYVYDKEGPTKTPIACVMIPVEILDREVE
ncbi:hypothetical protein MRX96_011313 [Rhipicephalus microplus]